MRATRTGADGRRHAGRTLFRVVGAVVVVLLAVALGMFLERWGGQRPTGASSPEEGGPTTWTCSMHPQIRQPRQGPCPICAMDLIPVDDGGRSASDHGTGPVQIDLSERARRLASLRTSVVRRAFPTAEIPMAGTIVPDETRRRVITAWVGGRLDRLFVHSTGVPLNAGEHLARIYSPELLSGQEELLQALKARERLKNSSLAELRETAEATVQAVRDKLALLGLAADQIRAIESSAAVRTHVTLRAPISGIVLERHAEEGAYVHTGSPIYTMADLSRLWVELEAYEADLPWIRPGQKVAFRTVSSPGTMHEGTVVFVDPVVQPRKRSVTVRLVVSNGKGILKPGMFVRAILKARIAADGRVVDSGLAGAWICSMHPEVVAREAGACTICGMPLVTAESLGFVGVDEKDVEPPLLVPASAPLVTGRRAVVYVAVPGTEGRYEGREIVLGPRAGDDMIVREGLLAGERVVTRGNFKIDGAVQIRAEPSMMSARDDDDLRRGHPQRLCPVMGNPIVRSAYVDHDGKRVYFCCPGCDATFLADPETYMARMKARGVVLEDAPSGAARPVTHRMETMPVAHRMGAKPASPAGTGARR